MAPSGGNCSLGDGDLKLAFDGSTWTQGGVDRRNGTGTQINARSWMNVWEFTRRENGQIAVDTKEQYGEVEAYFDPNLAAQGNASCSGGYLRLNVALMTSSEWNRFRGTFQHEIGHTIGLNHAHSVPALGGNIPLMATCIGADTKSFSQDESSGNARHNTTPYSNINPDPGFENNGYAWATIGGTTSSSSISRSGARSRIIGPGGTVYQVAAMTSEAGAPNHSLKGEVYALASQSNYTGSMYIDVIRRVHTYANDTSPCDWSSTFDENQRTGVSTVWVSVGAAYGAPSASNWSFIPTAAGSSGGNVREVVMRVINYMNIDIRVDDARLRWY